LGLQFPGGGKFQVVKQLFTFFGNLSRFHSGTILLR
jgi:hypothetical protein